MIVRRFLLWSRTAEPDQRAEAVGALARAYLDSDLSVDDQREAEAALIAMLDDPSPLVRLALAEAFAVSIDAPRPVVLALANDHSAIASIVLCGSPLLTEGDLVDCAALGDACAQTAIALRPQVSAAVAGALAEVAAPAAIVALLGNPGAVIADVSLRRIIERFGAEPDVRQALLTRGGLRIELKHLLAVALSRALAASADDAGAHPPERLEQLVREAQDRAALALAHGVDTTEVRRLVAHLRRSGQLTPALLLRALLSHGLAFGEAVLAELTDTPLARVASLLHDRRGAGFSALYEKAGLPRSLKPAVAAALSALRDEATGHDSGAGLSRRLIERVLTACGHLSEDEFGAVLSLLRRYEGEAAREEARALADAMAREAEAVLELTTEDLAADRAADSLEDLFQDAA